MTCRFTSQPRQQLSTEAGTVADHASASPDDTNQFGANGSYSARGFHWETGRRMHDAYFVREKNWSQKGPAPCARVGKGQRIYWGPDEPYDSLLLIEVSRILTLCVHLWWKAKTFYWGHELWNQTALWILSMPTVKTEQNEVHVPTARSICLHWSCSRFLQRLLTPLEY